MRTSIVLLLALSTVPAAQTILTGCGSQESFVELPSSEDATAPDATTDAPSGDASPPPALDVPPSPVECAVSPCVTALAAAANAMCALMEDTSVRCWGSNANGLLGRGDPTIAASPVPAPVKDLSGVVQIAGFETNFCATLSNGTVACWGANPNGELGQSTFEAGVIVPSAVPLVVPGVAGATGVFVGDRFACAALSEGDLMCWGFGAVGGRMPGIPAKSLTRLPPSRIDLGGIRIKSMALGMRAVVAIADDGVLLSWGESSRLADSNVTTLGRESSLAYARPDVIPTLAHASNIATSRGYDTCVASSGLVYCWGLTSIQSSILPTFIDMGTRAKAQTVSNLCATFDDGKARCVGTALSNQNGELGNGTLTATQLRATDVLLQGHAVGVTRTCALLRDGSVMCWGKNDLGQMGIGAQDLNPHPTPAFVRFEP